MFYVTSSDGSQVEPLINIGTDFKLEQSVDGTFQVSFSVFPAANNPGYDLLRSKSIVTVEDCDFSVEQYSDTAFSKSVTAISTFYKHSKTRKNGVFSGNHTLANHLVFALAGTGWTYTVDSAIANVTNYIDGFGDDNVISLVDKIRKYHACEFMILSNNRIHFARQIGGDYDWQYRYRHNLSSVVLKEDTSNLATIIRGYGANDLAVSYRSPNAAVFGELEAEPIKDERFTSAEALTNYIKNQLQDVPELAIESTIPELTARETGERIWLIHEPLGIEMQTRILSQTKSLVNGQLITSSVVFGNTLVKSSTDILVEQKQYIDETNDTIVVAKEEYRSKFEQTDDRISMEVEQLDASIATVSIKADNINLAVNNRITQEVAAIDIRADGIELSVNNRITNEMAAINLKADNINLAVSNRITNEVAAIDVKLNQIRLSVNGLEDDVFSEIEMLEDEISLKVNRGDLISEINMEPGSITIDADKINLNGAVIVNGSITGATDIDVSTNLRIGTRIYFSDMTTISSSNGDVTIDVWGDIEYQASRHYFYGTVDFSNADVVGLDLT